MVVLSRLEIIEASFSNFLVRGKPERLDHSDYHGGKGFVQIRVRTPSGAVTVVDTHLHARYVGSAEQDEYLEVRVAQAIQLSAALESVDEPLIAMGDFNLVDDESEYRVLMGLAGWEDVAAELDAKQPTTGRANPYSGGVSRRIDYVFTRSGRDRAIRGVATRRVLDEPFLIDGVTAAYSDHFGVLAELEIGGVPGPRRLPDSATLELAQSLLARGQELTSRRERRQQIGAVSTALASAALWQAAPRWTRRDWLRILLRGGAVAGITVGAGVGWLGLAATPEELRAFRAVERQLASLWIDPARIGAPRTD